MNVDEALEWALDCLSSDDEVIGTPEPGKPQEYTLNGVTMSRSTQYAESLAEAKAALAATEPRSLSEPLDVERLARALDDVLALNHAGIYSEGDGMYLPTKGIARLVAANLATDPSAPDRANSPGPLDAFSTALGNMGRPQRPGADR